MIYRFINENENKTSKMMILKVYIYFPVKIVLYANSFIYTIFDWETNMRYI